MIVADTHVLVWMLQSDAVLGDRTRNLLDTAMQEDGIGIPAISLWEIAMRVDKGKLELGRPVRQWIDMALAVPNIHLLSITPTIAVDAGTLPGKIHGDPADRLIVATARQLRMPLLTADHSILEYAKSGHLEAIDARR